MSKIEQTFARLAQHQEKALIPFITAGDPHPDWTVKLMHALAKGGADIIEVGIPFSDPMADGPTIQKASERALKWNVSLSNVLDMVAQFRVDNSETPIVLMGYLNPVMSMGFEKFAKLAAVAGVDGLLTVDCPPEEGEELFSVLKSNGIDPILLVSPTTPESRLEKIAEFAQGFIYYVSIKGVTGSSHLDIDEVTSRIDTLKQKTNVPVSVGFGIRDAQTARAVSQIAQGVVVGSRLVELIESEDLNQVEQKLTEFVRELKNAIKS